ncbi:MAG: RDD family protein [Candidatus Bathyarchaeota archaeon]|nr:RDD family protein [Candidatus Bathyarchaeota archaeon]
MTANQETVTKILSVLSHRIRREILLMLCDKGESSFTDLLNALNVDTGKLSFHIRSLSEFIEQKESGKYALTRAGENAVRVIRDVESWAEMPNANGKDSLLRLASFAKRALAYVVDFFVMFALAALFMIQSVVALNLTNWVNWLIVGLNILFVAAGLIWLYSTIMEGFNGQTIGKRLLGLMVVQPDNRKISYEHAAVRNFGKVVLPFDLVVGYVLNDKKFVRYFDKFAGTTVIDLRKKQPIPQQAELQG